VNAGRTKTGNETKKMAKNITATAADDSKLTSRVGAWPERTKGFLHDVRNEMRKVNSPSRKEVQATTGVVVITVALFAIYFFVIDWVLGSGIDWVLRSFKP
jgi:preprotein translocase subunit SecE